MTIDQLNTTIIPKISLMVKTITKWRELRELKREKWSFSLSVNFLASIISVVGKTTVGIMESILL